MDPGPGAGDDGRLSDARGRPTAPTQPATAFSGPWQGYAPTQTPTGLLRPARASYGCIWPVMPPPTPFSADISGGAGLWPGAAGHQGGGESATGAQRREDGGDGTSPADFRGEGGRSIPEGPGSAGWNPRQRRGSTPAGCHMAGFCAEFIHRLRPSNRPFPEFLKFLSCF